MKILIVCMMLLHEMRVGEPLTHNRWREQEQPVNSPALFNRDDTAEEDRPWNSNSNSNDDDDDDDDDKLPSRLDGLIEEEKRIGKIMQHVRRTKPISNSACSCKSVYELRDLGEGHYPRLVTAVRCESDLRSCKLVGHTVNVLRLRQANEHPADRYSAESTELETPLPESLRRKWQLKSLKIPVACIGRN